MCLQEGVGPAAADAWRLYNSMAGQAAYTAILCESLQDLTLLALEFNNFPESPPPDENDSLAGRNSAQRRQESAVSALLYR